MRISTISAIVCVLLLPPLISAQTPPPEKDKDIGRSFSIPYRLSDSGHIVVRAKINGKGPYNFIVDTGAPLVYVCEPVAKKLDIKASKKGATTLQEFQIEGGPVQKQFKCVIETPFQLEGMNALGAAGLELHGMIGYTLLAQFKMEIDLTKDRMTWTKLDFTPPAPQPIGIKGNVPDQLDAMGKFMKTFAALLGNKGVSAPKLRGFIGLELAQKDKEVVIQSVLANGPAAAAGLQAGDRLLDVQGKNVSTSQAAIEHFAKIAPGQQVRLTIQREGAKQEITITAGEGM